MKARIEVPGISEDLTTVIEAVIAMAKSQRNLLSCPRGGLSVMSATLCNVIISSGVPVCKLHGVPLVNLETLEAKHGKLNQISFPPDTLFCPESPKSISRHTLTNDAVREHGIDLPE